MYRAVSNLAHRCIWAQTSRLAIIRPLLARVLASCQGRHLTITPPCSERTPPPSPANNELSLPLSPRTCLQPGAARYLIYCCQIPRLRRTFLRRPGVARGHDRYVQLFIATASNNNSFAPLPGPTARYVKKTHILSFLSCTLS